jgi:nitrogen regulatory protein PII
MAVTLAEIRSVRIVCDDYHKDRILEHSIHSGATGYTLWKVHGKGEHPAQTGVFIQVWCNPEVAEKILTYCHCLSSQFRSIGMIVGLEPLWIHEAEANGLLQRVCGMAVKLVEVRAVRIICDPVLKDGVLKQLADFGAAGFTWWDAHGKGHPETVPDVQTISGFHQSFGAENRVCIEAWCNLEVADMIVAYSQGSQFRGIGMIVGISPLLIHEDEAAKFAKK